MKRVSLFLALMVLGCSTNGSGQVVFTLNDAIILSSLSARPICYYSAKSKLDDITLSIAVLNTIKLNLMSGNIAEVDNVYSNLEGHDRLLADSLTDSLKFILTKLDLANVKVTEIESISLAAIKGCLSGLISKKQEVEREQFSSR